MAFEAWPQWLYKATGEGKLFETEADVPADGGWLEYEEVFDDRGELLPPAPTPKGNGAAPPAPPAPPAA